MSKLVIISGATATGKSDLAVAIAKELTAEIISADSMQLYKGMDIGTAKLTMEERNEIPHHFLDVVDVKDDVTVSWYQELARAKIDELRSENKSVVVVGGTGLYIKAILDDLNFPETDPEVREKLNLEAGKIGGDAMHERLSKLDPAAGLAIPKENVRRVVRALEVIEITGKPFTAVLPRVDSSKYPDAMQFGLAMNRETLDARIDNRVSKMWDLGFVDEVETLINQGLLEGRTAQAAIGYAQIVRMKHGEFDEAFAREDTARATRQYARRQETWFSRDLRITWLSATSNLSERTDSVLQAILKS
ncbi:MAG: tRNA (adenosine(37)-N6)-dimethylallyltransferase MiaA [Actinobacteria bacterium]|nr:tRNA (adenosine(37)-N6)-dimethylallyltransferase MiaA [Actinomycetota bacterium]